MKSRLLKIIGLVFVACLLMAVPVLAAGQGGGNGSGGGQNEPLNLTSSQPADGEKNIPTNGEIKLSFNKNVVNMNVKDNNKACFEIYSSDGTKIPIEVIMADDQVNPEQKQDISLKPLQQLNPGTAYVVKISPQLQAKNGMMLDQEIIINFETAATGINSSPTNTETQEKATTAVPNNSTEPGPQSSKWIYIVIIGAILAAVGGYFYLKNNSQK